MILTRMPPVNSDGGTLRLQRAGPNQRGQCRWNDSIYQPLVMLWVFLSQVLSEEHSCRAAVARLIAHRLVNGQSACSAETGAYCTARKRLPEMFFADVARQTGRALNAQASSQWSTLVTHDWFSMRVELYLIVNLSVRMHLPDTGASRIRFLALNFRPFL